MSVKEAPEYIKTILKTIPESAGVYQYYDDEGKILYVGKAKNLKKRVSSYFTKDQYDSRKTVLLVRKIKDIKFIVVESELDALLLENNVIKEYQPKYNVLLKDDKTFPWICIKKEPYPRIFPTRSVVRDGSLYFGPYANVKMMHTLLGLVRHLYPLRTCNLKLTKENIKAEKFKVCLEYHIGNCKGPCIDKQTEEDYESAIKHIKKIIKGNVREVHAHLKKLMGEYSEKLQFEQAQIIKEKIVLLERFQSRSTVVSPVVENADVFSIVSDVKSAYVNYLRVIEGAIVQAHTLELKKKLDETDQELLEMAIVELSQRFESNSKEYIVPFELGLGFPNKKIIVPQRGDRSKLLKLSERNALTYKHDKDKQTEIIDPERNCLLYTSPSPRD